MCGMNRLKPPDLVWIGVLLSVTAGCAGLAEREPKVSRVTTDARGRLSVNGQPFFLREIYTLRNREDFAVAKACGFNAVIEQGGEVLDMALANGMMVTIPNWFALGYDADAVRRQVERFGSHRALLAWNLCDEPDLRVNESPPSLMKEVGAMLRQLDPHHPLSVTCAGGAGQRHWKDFADAVDVFRIDPYPVIARRPIADVARMTRAAREAAGGQKPVFVILQAWIGDEGDRLPTAQEDRCMTYMALIEGAKGISHFDFNVGTWQRSSSFWNGLMAMNLELQRLSPILLDGLDEKVSVSRGKARVMAKEHAGRTYVFVANPQPSVSDFTVALERGPVWDVKALFENVFFDEKARRVQAAGRGFWDVLPAFGAAVYEVRRWPWQASLADAASVVVEPSSQAQAVRVMSRRHFIVKNVTDDRVRASAEWLTGRKPSVFELDAAHRRMRRVGHERGGGTLEFMAAPQTAYEIGSLADVVDAQLR
ncbi:MAG: hypothetical protein FJ272_18985, partial [Planctomycetes bacterium]|nr:hypothetical protein [Planctomycetota bacterium]